MSIIRGKIDHTAINDVLRRYKDTLSSRSTQFLRKLRVTIQDYLKGDLDNVKVYIYVDDVLDEPIVVQSGDGDNELVLQLDENDEPEYTWTKETFWKKTKDFFRDVAAKIVGFVKSAIETIAHLAVGASKLLALT